MKRGLINNNLLGLLLFISNSCLEEVENNDSEFPWEKIEIFNAKGFKSNFAAIFVFNVDNNCSESLEKGNNFQSEEIIFRWDFSRK